jgi:sec-independent protein translocase protein TatC
MPKDGPVKAGSDNQAMPIWDHLEELRRRLAVGVVVLAVFTVAMYFMSSRVLVFLEQPLNGTKLVGFGPVDGFTIRLQLAFWSAVILSSPVWMYELLAFVLPGLTRSERRLALPTIASVGGLFILGAGAGYLLLTPTMDFLLSQYGPNIQYLPGITKYINMALFMMIALGVAFEFPVVMVLTMSLGLVEPRWYRRSRRITYFVLFAFAELITPVADPIVMPMLVLVPLIALYEVTLIIGTRLARRSQDDVADIAT